MVYLKNNDSEIDVRRLANRSKKGIIISTVTLILFLLVGRNLLAFLIFGTTDPNKVVPVQGPAKTVFLAIMVVSGNSIDLVSIAIYLQMRKSLSKRIQPVDITENDHRNNFHGQNIYILARNCVNNQTAHVEENRMVNMNNSEFQKSDSICSTPEELPPVINPMPPPSATMDHKTKQEAAVAMALEMHVMSSLIDALVPVFGLLTMNQRVVVSIPVTIFMTSWWPIILTVRTHTKLRNVIKEEMKEVFKEKAKYLKCIKR